MHAYLICQGVTSVTVLQLMQWSLCLIHVECEGVPSL